MLSIPCLGLIIHVTPRAAALLSPELQTQLPAACWRAFHGWGTRGSPERLVPNLSLLGWSSFIHSFNRVFTNRLVRARSRDKIMNQTDMIVPHGIYSLMQEAEDNITTNCDKCHKRNKQDGML